MPKQLMVRDDILRKLDKIRDEFNCSYSDTIGILLKKEPSDLVLVEINECFERLRQLIPNMLFIWEMMRVIAIHFHYLRGEVQKNEIDNIGEKLKDVLDYIISIKKKSKESIGGENGEL
jgi:predicted CopG family antitoxin